MNPPESPDLYWTGGPFRVKLGCPNTMQEDLPNKGVEVLECLKSGGVFEDQNAKAFLVTILHRWDEHFRPSIARLLSVGPNAVQCDLMGDLRIVRNALSTTVPTFHPATSQGSEPAQGPPHSWKLI